MATTIFSSTTTTTTTTTFQLRSTTGAENQKDGSDTPSVSPPTEPKSAVNFTPAEQSDTSNKLNDAAKNYLDAINTVRQLLGLPHENENLASFAK
ncbi:MAG: hypothetical protein ACRBBN_13325, partial [Methyloligellaceae bacterium]